MSSKTKRLPALIVFSLLVIGANADIPNDIEDGILLFKKGDYIEAKACFLRILDETDNNSEARLYLGRVYFNEKNLDEAEKMFQTALKLQDTNSNYHYWLALTYGEKARNAGILKGGGLAKKMKAHLIRSIELDPDNIDARHVLLQYYISAPKIMGGDSQKATEHADEIMKRDSFKGLCSYGWIYGREKKHEKALKYYLKALEMTKIDTSNSRKNRIESEINELGYKLLGKGDTYQAIQVFQINVENFPESLNVYDSLAEAYMKSGNKELAINFYKKAVKMNPRKTEWEKKMYMSGVKQIQKLGGTI